MAQTNENSEIANLAGVWKLQSTSGQYAPELTELDLKQDGETITGFIVIKDGQRSPIETGKILQSTGYELTSNITAGISHIPALINGRLIEGKLYGVVYFNGNNNDPHEFSGTKEN